jgi:sirohydrochlorin ferrochelatase
MEKNCGQETFVVPSFVIAALHVNASKRSEISLPLPEIEDKPLPNLKVNQNNLILTRISKLQ